MKFQTRLRGCSCRGRRALVCVARCSRSIVVRIFSSTFPLRAVSILVVLMGQTSFPEGFGVLVDGFTTTTPVEILPAFVRVRSRASSSASVPRWLCGGTRVELGRHESRRHDNPNNPRRHRSRNLLSRRASSSASESPLSPSHDLEYDVSLLRSFLTELDRSLLRWTTQVPTTTEFQSFAIAFDHGKKKTVKTSKKGSNSTSTTGAAPPRRPLPGSLKMISGRLVRLSVKRKNKSAKTQTMKREDRVKEQAIEPLVFSFDSEAHPSFEPTTMVMHVTFKYHGATDIVKNWPVDDVSANLEQVMVRLLEQPPQPNSSTASSEDSIARCIATEWGSENLNPFSSLPPGGGVRGGQQIVGRIETITCRWELKLAVVARGTTDRAIASAAATRSSSLQSRRRSANRIEKDSFERATKASVQEHDRRKQVPVSISERYWQALGVTDVTGRLKPDMASKFRQCQKFVEIVSQLIRSSWTEPPQSAGNHDTRTMPVRPIHVTDMGCGRGYLTFALHSYLQQLANATITGPPTLPSLVQTVGVDVRPKLVADLNRIVTTLYMTGLRFEPGTIQDYVTKGKDQFVPLPLRDSEAAIDGCDRATNPVRALIALHACDTATDDALYAAIQRRTDVVVTAPCCHKQLRPQINQLIATVDPHPLSDVLCHGIYRERTAETVTDSLRALLLELAGYKTKVFEFIGGEHTAKNCMITGVLKCDKEHRRPIHQETAELDSIRHRIRSLAMFYGIRRHKLAELMGEQELLMNHQDKIPSLPLRRSALAMPPL